MKQFGLIVSDPSQDSALRQSISSLLSAQEIPFFGFTDTPAPLFADCPDTRAAFLFRAAYALMQPGQPLPADFLLRHLSGDAQPGNVIRKYTCLQLSFLPYLRPGRTIVPLDGGVRIGDDLLVLRLSDEGTIDASLPDGLWAELSGLCWTGRCRQIRGYNALPVLIRENALFPVGVNDRTTDADDADRVVLHWFQPDFTTECTLADGTFYRVTQIGAGFRWETNATKEWHLIIHRGSEEQFVR